MTAGRDAYARAKDPRVRQVTVSLAATLQAVEVLRGDGETYPDIRPLVRVNVSVVVGDGSRQETGSDGYGGRESYERFIATDVWQSSVDKAVSQALINLEAVPAPAGEMDVVLGPGWPGVMLHEAIGHGLEGDFNRKKTSAFAGLVGQRVAAKGVTVVDDGTMSRRRGSLSIDDEGTPTNRTVAVALAALSVSLSAARSDEYPTLNVEPLCRGIADQSSLELGFRNVTFDECVKAERADRETMIKEWSSVSSDDKRHCIAEATMGGESSYTDLLTCLEMARDVRTLNNETSDSLQQNESGQPRKHAKRKHGA